LDNFFEINIADTLGLLINFLTLLFAYKIYRNFDIRKAHINKQLDTVLDLVQEINQTLIPVNFWRKVPKHVLESLPDQFKEKAALEGWHFTLFIIGDLKNETPKFDNVFLSTNIKSILPFILYMNNPLLPPKIAESLSRFYSPLVSYGSFENASDKFVELSTLSKHEQDAGFQFPDIPDTYKTWDSFIESAKNVKVQIDKWLKKYGTTDINYNFNLQHPRL
jgi:hypothetical protein